MGINEHRKNAIKSVAIGIITLSSTRNLENDLSGQWIYEKAAQEGHNVICHKVILDHKETISKTILDIIEKQRPHALLMNGGTGVSPKDVTIEAVKPFFEKELTGFGSIFAQLSFEQIKSAAVLSRAAAGIIQNTIVFCMPGSLKAVKLACEQLIFPDLGHLVNHLWEDA
ncbi:Molybdenum cofactor biosynthesis protein [Desulfonema limicola]|uniref:Molybdenum cofactor biosynthesis protein B n=1 Tax=Desulfonema limicola TaxID=45656 RepID=A0A975B3B6_9BACT|nr:MogA/MoaB family molybdenum cofactor biosynthesis protein [Desulfonema limicola]QTA78022.1 Molybdenum cofactor biosynthesis protein [Desulfonema limicola]